MMHILQRLTTGAEPALGTQASAGARHSEVWSTSKHSFCESLVT